MNSSRKKGPGRRRASIGYDIASYDPDNDRLRFIEVKGLLERAETQK